MAEEAINSPEDEPAGEIQPGAELSYTDAPPIDSQHAWDQLNDWLPEMLERLRTSEPFDDDSQPPSTRRGIYLFSEGSVHLYVGAHEHHRPLTR